MQAKAHFQFHNKPNILPYVTTHTVALVHQFSRQDEMDFFL